MLVFIAALPRWLFHQSCSKHCLASVCHRFECGGARCSSRFGAFRHENATLHSLAAAYSSRYRSTRQVALSVPSLRCSRRQKRWSSCFKHCSLCSHRFYSGSSVTCGQIRVVSWSKRFPTSVLPCRMPVS